MDFEVNYSNQSLNQFLTFCALLNFFVCQEIIPFIIQNFVFILSLFALNQNVKEH